MGNNGYFGIVARAGGTDFQCAQRLRPALFVDALTGEHLRACVRAQLVGLPPNTTQFIDLEQSCARACSREIIDISSVCVYDVQLDAWQRHRGHAL